MNFGERVSRWAESESFVEALVLIGSQARSESDQIWKSDSQSDWDFQVITSRPEMFLDSAWAKSLGCEIRTYAVRRAALGDVAKPTVIFDGAEADFVILSSRTLKMARAAVQWGIHRRSKIIEQKLRSLAVVIRPGWKFLKGGDKWAPFFEEVVAEISDPRLSDDDIRRLADVFVCDVVWMRRKLDRGEFLAAQRAYHHCLLETNFKLLHELRLRSGQRSFPEIRRAERLLDQPQLAAVSGSVALNDASLRAGLEHASSTCRTFTAALVGSSWKWPSSLL
jgi:hypothetical protein